jgi:hypothetical protein
MRWQRLFAGLVLVGLVAPGCARFSHEQTVEVGPAVEKTLTIDPPSSNQTLKVEFSSPGSPVNVYCYLQKDEAEAKKAIMARKKLDKVLGSKEKSEQDSFEVTIPAREEAVVLVTAAGKKASVQVKLTGR